MEYGLQLYSMRDLAEKDLMAALEMAAEIGYKGIEFAGFFGFSADVVKEKLDALKLQAWGTHTGWTALTDDQIEATIAYHQAINCTKLIVPGADLSNQEKLDAFIAVMEKARPRLAAAGITLGYHNHSHEFIANEDGSMIYDQQIARTQVAFELDTYWAYNAGKDPVDMMEQMSDRLFAIHIKDGKQGGEGYPLGMGTAPVQAVYQKAIEVGIPMIVESETLKPDGATEARICFEYLKTLES